MVEPQKGTTSSVNAKEKDSLLDLDFGKDFLSPWKSMSTDDAMDLDFGPVSKGKKKAFNFDKADMDFNLDGDFGKMPSFNIEMPDLDISSPVKKDTKPKERSSEPASGNKKGKADGFSFAFDFNELDSFNFKSSLRDDDNAKTKEDKENPSNSSGSQNSADHSAADNGTHEDVIFRNLPEAGVLTTSKIDSQVGGSGDLDSTTENFPLKSVTDDNADLNPVVTINEVVSHKAVTSFEKTIFNDKKRLDCQLDKSISPESVPQEACIANEAMQDVYSTSENELSRDTVSELQVEVSSVAARRSGSSEKDNGGSQVFTNDHALEGNKDGVKHAEAESFSERCSPSDILRESFPNKQKTHNTLEHSTNPLKSRTTANNLKPGKEREAFTTRSKYFKRPDETEDQFHNASNHTKHSSVSVNIIGTRQPSHADESRNANAKEAHSQGNVADISLSHSGAPVSKEHLEIGNQESCKGPKSNGPIDRDITQGKPASGGGDKHVKSVDSIRLSGQMDKSRSQNCLNSEILDPNVSTIQTMKNGTLAGDKASSFKATRQMPMLSSLKFSRSSVAEVGSPKSIAQKDVTLSKDVEQNKVLAGTKISKATQFVEKKKQTPPGPSLKRKMIETSDADVISKSPKHLSQLPSNRISPQMSRKVFDKEACNKEDMVDGNSTSIQEISQNSTLDVAWEANMKGLDSTYSIENDRNVEKAEACAKELEYICKMLRKKHDEAKETLVRAVVNNNKLLMLNHPLYDQKIRLVQKFAEQLTLRELHTQT